VCRNCICTDVCLTQPVTDFGAELQVNSATGNCLTDVSVCCMVKFAVRSIVAVYVHCFCKFFFYFIHILILENAYSRLLHFS